MKKALLPLALLSIIAAIAIWSCKKTNNPSTTSGVTPSLNQVFAGLRYTPQNLSVTAGRDTIVYGTKGTMLHFYTNSFQDASGNIITSGTIYLQLVEMYKAGDMICNRTATMANGQMLASGGEITINATMNGQQVFANKYGIGFGQTGSSSAPMALYYGNTNNGDSIATWTQSDTTKNGTKVNGTTYDSADYASGASLHGVNFYIFDTCTNFTFANCDWFYSGDSVETTVSVVLPDTSFNPNNTQLFLVLPNVTRWGNTTDTFTAVLSSDEGYGPNAYTTTTHTMNIMSESHTDIVPEGMSYELVVITNKNGTYYYYEQAGTIPHNGLVATAAMAVETQGDIITRLQGL